MSVETDVLTQFYAAINRNDMQAMAAHLDPLVVRVEPAGFPSAGTHRGIAAVREHVASGRGTWAEGSCEPASRSSRRVQSRVRSPRTDR
jgi:uncharacterized protein